MRQLPLNPELATIAGRILWFEPPIEALSDPVRFMASAMTYATHEDMKVIRSYVDNADFREALELALPETPQT